MSSFSVNNYNSFLLNNYAMQATKGVNQIKESWEDEDWETPISSSSQSNHVDKKPLATNWEELEDLDISIPNSIPNTDHDQQIAKTVDLWATNENLLDDTFEQGRIAPHFLLDKQILKHENGIFGSYCLEDVKGIANLVLKTHPFASTVNYDCFNYETVEEIVTNPELAARYIENKRALDQHVLDKELTYNIHYDDKHNDLLESKEQASGWRKFDRKFSKNMFFFNPYLDNFQNTHKLINSFFSYAHDNLESEGVVAIMWNSNRSDSLKDIKIEEIAKSNQFKIIKVLSGKSFASQTTFTHLKNGRSLDLAQEKNIKVSVNSKNTDAIMLFKHKTSLSNGVDKTNLVAIALLKNIKAVKTSSGESKQMRTNKNLPLQKTAGKGKELPRVRLNY